MNSINSLGLEPGPASSVGKLKALRGTAQETHKRKEREQEASSGAANAVQLSGGSSESEEAPLIVVEAILPYRYVDGQTIRVPGSAIRLCGGSAASGGEGAGSAAGAAPGSGAGAQTSQR